MPYYLRLSTILVADSGPMPSARGSSWHDAIENLTIKDDGGVHDGGFDALDEENRCESR